MSMDMIHSTKAVLALTPAALTSFGAGAAIDTAGFEALMFVIPVGAFSTFSGTDKLTVKVQESDTTTDGDFTDIAAGDYLGTYKGGTSGWDKIMDGADDDDACFAIGVRINTKRYKRLHFTEGGTVNVPIGAVALLGHPRHMPIGDTH
jgi:hypothetical protein